MGCSDSKENLKEQIEEESGGQITRDCVGNIFNVTGFTSQELFNAWTMYKSLVSGKSYKISNRKLLELPIINVSPFGYHFLEAFDLCGVQSSKEKENASLNDNNDDDEEDDFDKNESETSKRKKRQIEGEITNIKARQRRPPQRFKSCLNDKKEHITFEMFCNILYFFSEHASFDEKCAVMFKLYDFDNDGKITMRDIETYLFRIKADSSKKFLDAEEMEEYDPAMYPVVLDPQYLNDEELDAIEREQKENDERRRKEKEKDYEKEDEDDEQEKDNKDSNKDNNKDKKKMNNDDAPGNAEDNDDNNGSNNESANPPRKKRFGFKKVLITPFPNPPQKNKKDKDNDDDDDEDDDNGSEKEKRPQMNETEDNDNDNEEENEDDDKDNNDKDKEAIKVNEDKKKEDEIQDELTKRLLEKLEALNPELQIAQIIMKESATNGRNYLDYFDFKFILEGTDTLPEYSHNLYLEEYKEEQRCHCPDYCCGDD